MKKREVEIKEIVLKYSKELEKWKKGKKKKNRKVKPKEDKSKSKIKKKKYSAYKAQILRLEEKNYKQKLSFKTLKEEYKMFKNDLSILRDDNEENKETLRFLSEQLFSLKNRYSSYEAKNQYFRDQIDSKNRKIEKMIEDHQKKKEPKVRKDETEILFDYIQTDSNLKNEFKKAKNQLEIEIENENSFVNSL